MADFTKAKYFNLETYRKNGTPVLTPVWFATSPSGEFYVYSEANAGKVKRIRNNSRVRIAVCNVRGLLLSEWVDASARVVDSEEALRAHRLLTNKYGFLKRMGDFFGGFLMRRKRAVLAIHLT